MGLLSPAPSVQIDDNAVVRKFKAQSAAVIAFVPGAELHSRQTAVSWVQYVGAVAPGVECSATDIDRSDVDGIIAGVSQVEVSIAAAVNPYAAKVVVILFARLSISLRRVDLVFD